MCKRTLINIFTLNNFSSHFSLDSNYKLAYYYNIAIILAIL